MAKIHELVQEALMAAQHHKESTKGGAEAYGSSNSVTWDDEVGGKGGYGAQVGKKAVVDEKLVDVVLDALKNNDILSKATPITTEPESYGGKSENSYGGNVKSSYDNDYGNQKDRGLVSLLEKGYFGSLGKKARANGRY
jgi:hypothetical protein